MTTFEAAGIRTYVDGPPPEAPPHGLLSVPGVRVDPGDSRYMNGRWQNGVVVWGYPEDPPFFWEPCAEGTFDVKEDTADMPTATFDAVAAYVPVNCGARGPSLEDELVRRAVGTLDATISWAAERFLASGTVGIDNPNFQDASVLASGVTAAVGLSWLENAIGATGRRGIIHVTPAVASALLAEKIVIGNNGVLTTISGNYVAVGGGYIDQGPTDPAAGSDYMFATGPVWVFVSDLDFTEDISQVLDRSNNDVVYRAERWILPIWDTALNAAVLVDWTP